MVIVSKQNPLVKELSALLEKKGRRERGTFLVEGEKMVREAVACGMDVRRIVVREDYAGETFDALPRVTLGGGAFAAVSSEKTPQGIAAEVALPVREIRPPAGRCLLLDGLQDPANVGAIVRTAVAAGYGDVYLADCADPFSPKSVRASMSGVFFARLMQGAREELLAALAGVPVIAGGGHGRRGRVLLPCARGVLPRRRKRGQGAFARGARACGQDRAHPDGCAHGKPQRGSLCGDPDVRAAHIVLRRYYHVGSQQVA